LLPTTATDEAGAIKDEAFAVIATVGVNNASASTVGAASRTLCTASVILSAGLTVTLLVATRTTSAETVRFGDTMTTALAVLNPSVSILDAAVTAALSSRTRSIVEITLEDDEAVPLALRARSTVATSSPTQSSLTAP